MKPFIRILFGFFFQQELVFLLLVQKQLLRLVKQLMKSFNLFPFISNCSWRYRKLVSDLVSDFWFPFSPVSLLPVDFDGISETIFLVSDFWFPISLLSIDNSDFTSLSETNFCFRFFDRDYFDLKHGLNIVCLPLILRIILILFYSSETPLHLERRKENQEGARQSQSQGHLPARTSFISLSISSSSKSYLFSQHLLTLLAWSATKSN